LVCLISINCQKPPPPVSEVFSSNVQIYITEETRNTTGTGVWGADKPNGKEVEIYTFSDHSEEHLSRYDLHKSFDILVNSGCAPHNLDGTMPMLWDWVKNATYSQKTINGVTYDSWSLSFGYATLVLAFDSTSTPIWFIRISPLRTVMVQFLNWQNSVANPTVFDVPANCPAERSRVLDKYIEDKKNQNGNVGCVARATMMNRADIWVINHVPYDQGATYGGYREDCSGYVSMAWESSKPGHTTFTMPTISREITKAELQNGDVLLCVSEHVVLFGGWADADHTHYIAYEETRPGEGTVKRVTPYPYWYNTGCFIPHRYDSVC